MKKKRNLITALAAVLMLVVLFSVPAQAGSISAKCKKAYQKYLENGEITYEYTYKYWGEKNNGSYGWKSTKYSGSDMVITGFRVLDLDGKGEPELILQARYKNSSDDSTFVVVARYHKGKVKLVTNQQYPSVKVGLYENIKSTFNGVTGKVSSKPKKTGACFYYSEKMKALYYHALSKETNKVSGKKQVSVFENYALTRIKNGKEGTYKRASMEESANGILRYTIQTGANKEEINYYSKKAYTAYVKQYFKAAKPKKYTFYANTKANRKNKVK